MYTRLSRIYLLMKSGLLLLDGLSAACSAEHARWLCHPVPQSGPVPSPMAVKRSLINISCSKSRRRCGRGGPSPGADVAGVGQAPAQIW
jgi:hypothetical protein